MSKDVLQFSTGSPHFQETTLAGQRNLACYAVADNLLLSILHLGTWTLRICSDTSDICRYVRIFMDISGIFSAFRGTYLYKISVWISKGISEHILHIHCNICIYPITPSKTIFIQHIHVLSTLISIWISMDVLLYPKYSMISAFIHVDLQIDIYIDIHADDWVRASGNFSYIFLS
jgi:hypothetical protein